MVADYVWLIAWLFKIKVYVKYNEIMGICRWVNYYLGLSKEEV